MAQVNGPNGRALRIRFNAVMNHPCGCTSVKPPDGEWWPGDYCAEHMEERLKEEVTATLLGLVYTP